MELKWQKCKNYNFISGQGKQAASGVYDFYIINLFTVEANRDNGYTLWDAKQKPWIKLGVFNTSVEAKKYAESL